MTVLKKTPQTVAERVAAFRARKKDSGLEEVRNIYAPISLHKAIKDYAKEVIKIKLK